MKIKVNELRKTLMVLKAGLSGGKETTDQSASFAFSNGEIFTYNDEISVRVPFDLDIEGAVSAKELLALVGKLKGEEATIEVVDGEIRIKCGRTRAGIKLEDEIRMPLEEIIIPKKWIPLPKEFKQALKASLFSTSNDASIAILTTVHCFDDLIESTDNDRASQWFLECEEKMDFLLPGDAGKALVGYSNIESWNTSEGWIHFKVNGTAIFSCRTFEGEYPDLNPYFDIKGNTIVFPSHILDMLDRAGVFVEVEYDQDQLVQITVSDKGILKVRAEGDTGWFEETCRLKDPPEKEIHFSINPDHLAEILKSVDKAVVDEQRILFDTENFRHVVALVV